MANQDIPNGFRPYSGPGNGNPVIQELQLLATNAAINIGDPVKIAADGVDRADAGDALCGIAAEKAAASSGGAEVYIKVYSDPMQLFVAQCDDGTTVAGAANDSAVGMNCNFIEDETNTGLLSIAELDESSATTTAALPFKLIGRSREIGRNAENAHGEFCRYIVKINNHQFQGSTGTVGI